MPCLSNYQNGQLNPVINVQKGCPAFARQPYNLNQFYRPKFSRLYKAEASLAEITLL